MKINKIILIIILISNVVVTNEKGQLRLDLSENQMQEKQKAQSKTVFEVPKYNVKQSIYPIEIQVKRIKN